MTTCEDYPCCGHEFGDCDGSLYGSDESIKQYAEQHLYCDHEAGVCDAWPDDEAHEWDYDDTNENDSPWCYGCDGYADEMNCDGK